MSNTPETAAPIATCQILHNFVSDQHRIRKFLSPDYRSHYKFQINPIRLQFDPDVNSFDDSKLKTVT